MNPEHRFAPEPPQQKPPEKKAGLTMQMDDGSVQELWDFRRHVMDRERTPEMTDSELALKLIATGKKSELAEHLDEFTGLSGEVGLQLISEGRPYHIAQNIEHFDPSAHKGIALGIVANGSTNLLLQFGFKFQHLDKDVYFAMLKNLSQNEYINVVTHGTMSRFGADANETIIQLNTLNKRAFHQFNVYEFKHLNETSAKLIAAGRPLEVMDNPDSFDVDSKTLDTVIAQAIAEKDHPESIIQTPLTDFFVQDGRQEHWFPKTFKLYFDLNRKRLETSNSFTEQTKIAETLRKLDSAAMEKEPWVLQSFVDQLLKLQARSAKAEHDPWITDLEPLLFGLQARDLFQMDDPADRELLVEFVKRFGMSNTPIIAGIFFNIQQKNPHEKTGKSVEIERGLEERYVKPLSKFLGREIAAGTQDKSILNELEQKQRWFLKELLADQIPKNIETAIGQELFNLIRGKTSWDADASAPPGALIRMWEETIKEHPELAELPEHYAEYQIEVPLVDRRMKTIEEEKDLNVKRAEVLALETVNKLGENVKTELGAFAESFYAARDISTSDQEYFIGLSWKDTYDRLVASVYPEQNLEETLSKRKAALEGKGMPAAKIKELLQKTQIDFERKKEEAGALRAALEKIGAPLVTEGQLAKQMEELVRVLPKHNAVNQIFLAFSMKHLMGIESQRAWTKKFQSLETTDENDEMTISEFDDLSSFFLDYVSEHYLQPKQETAHTGHTPFSPNLLKSLEFAWGRTQTNAAKEHVFVKIKNKLAALEKGESVETGKAKKISLVPTKGIMRIFAGDTGDACYTSQHQELAHGEFPGVTAYSFVTNRGLATERVQGSVLFVETEGDGEHAGKKVLIVRANNPRENLLGQVDADKLVKETLTVAIDLATARGLDMVVVPRDKATQSSSNRMAVSDYYKREFGRNEKVGLQNTPDTNFNGYESWDATREHAVVKIWERVTKV